MAILILHHGTKNKFDTNNFNPDSFFSTDYNFSEDYGKVSKFKVKIENCFDSSKDSHIRRLLKITDLYDNYNDITINDLNTYDEATNYHSDTWEVIEPYINEIKSLNKYDSIKIFEGGIVNYIIFDKSQVLTKINDNKIKCSNISNSL